MGKHNGHPPVPVIDPTANVKELVALHSKRQDDLRAAETRRIDELRAQRGVYEEKLAKQEAARLNEIRNTDVKAVYTASEKQETAARVLADAVARSAETLRTLVSSTAQVAAESQAQFAKGITDRLTVLEVARYEGVGKSGGIRDTWGWIFGAAMAALAIGGFVLSHYKW